jgi:hypothetical protein
MRRLAALILASLALAACVHAPARTAAGRDGAPVAVVERRSEPAFTRERGTCEQGGETFLVTAPVYAPDGRSPTQCSARLFDAAAPPTGFSKSAFTSNVGPEAVAAVRLGVLLALLMARDVPIIGVGAAPKVGLPCKVKPEGRFVATNIKDGRYVIEVACSEGHGTAEFTPPEPPPGIVLRPGATVDLQAALGQAPWEYQLLKDQSLLVTRAGDPARRVTITGLPPGRYLVGATVEGGGKVVGAVEVDLVEGKNPPIEIHALKGNPDQPKP